MRTFIALTTAAVAMSGAAFAAQKLTPKEIQTEFFDGKSFVAATTSGTKFKMTFATSGKEVVEWCEKDQFDLILMDVQLPEMDGLEATRQIIEQLKKQERNTPIVALTAYASEEDSRRCLQAGARDPRWCRRAASKAPT